MAGNISNWMVQITGDASGAVEAMHITETAADATSRSLHATGAEARSLASDFSAASDGMRRVAKQQELLDARKLKSQESSGRGRRGLDPMAAAMSPFSHERLVGGTSEPGAEVRLQDELTRSIVKGQAERTAAVAAGAANRVNISNQEMLREQQLAALREDMIARSATMLAQNLTAERAIRDNAWNEEKARTQQRHQEAMDLSAHLKARLTAEVANEVAAERAIRDNAWNQEKLSAQIHAKQMADLKADILRRNPPVASAMIAGMSGAGATQAASGSMIGQLNNWQQLQSARDAAFADEQAGYQQQRANRARQLDAKAADAARELDIINQTALANARARQQAEQAQVTADAEYRANRARQLDAKDKIRRDDEAAEAAHIKRMNKLRIDAIAAEETDRGQRLQSRITGAQNADTRNPMQAMEDSIARMRGELNPMVGMQHRLAREAMEFRQQMDLAVISGRMNWQTAQGILNTYEQVSAELQQQAMQQQAGFLGMRRMGFAAQQFGYAIEDAASVYGTMGLAGAFRAAGNNLTVMAAQAGAVPGVVASIASAAIALGINFYNARKEAEGLKKALEDVAEARSKFASQYQDEIALQQELSAARIAGVDSLRQMYESLGSSIARLTAQIEANAQAQAQTAAIEAAIKRVEELNKLAAERSSTWWSDNFRTVIMGWEYIRDAAKGTFAAIDDLATHLSATLSEVFDGIWMSFTGDFSGAAEKIRGAAAAGDRAIAEKRKLEQDQNNAANAMENQIRLQEKALKDLLDPEKQRLKLMEDQWSMMKDQSAEISANTLSQLAQGGWQLGREIDFRDRSNGKYDVRTPESMWVRDTFNDKRGELGQKTFIRDTDKELAASSRTIEKERDRLITLREQSTSLDEQKKLSDEIAARNEELLRIDQMRADLNAAGEASLEETNRTIMGRYEGLNEELRIENEVLRVRKKINEEIDIAVRSGHMNQETADKYRAEMESVLKLEEERRNNDKEIEKLQKREGTLEGLARQALTPATVVGGLTKGSDEARAFLENERLKSMAQKDADPQIKELKEIRAEIKRLRESNEKIGQSKPGVVTLV